MQKVYKNLWKSVRDLLVESASLHYDMPYIVYGNRRLTYGEVLVLSKKTAAVFRDSYNVGKGDRVAICSQNNPEYLIAFWACQFLGAVAVLINASLPFDPLLHCFQHTASTLILVDGERAARLLPAITTLRSLGAQAIIILDQTEPAPRLSDLRSWQDVQASYQEHNGSFAFPAVEPEDNCLIMFTSGTTGMPKGVLSTQRQFLTNIRNASVASSRATLRRGGSLTPPPKGPQKGMLVAVPLFHVSGCTSFSMMATAAGMKIVLTAKWDISEAVRLMRTENIRAGGGVPAMVSDLLQSPLAGQHPLEFFLFGGAPSADFLVGRAKIAFPDAILTHAFGSTETNAVAVSIAGEDYELRPSSTGIPCPVNDMIIVDESRKVVPHGVRGEVWLRGPNVITCYWNDTDATNKSLTKDGWFKTGDIGVIDSGGFLYIKDRIKDIIIRGGENIDSVSVENAIYLDDRISEVAAVGVPDERLGELVVAIVSVKSAFRGMVKESEIIEQCQRRLPRYAIPVMVLICDRPFELTPSGKIMKPPLREFARREWESRVKRGHTASSARL